MLFKVGEIYEKGDQNTGKNAKRKRKNGEIKDNVQ
jgi:hypothetical protein